MACDALQDTDLEAALSNVYLSNMVLKIHTCKSNCTLLLFYEAGLSKNDFDLGFANFCPLNMRVCAAGGTLPHMHTSREVPPQTELNFMLSYLCSI